MCIVDEIVANTSGVVTVESEMPKEMPEQLWCAPARTDIFITWPFDRIQVNIEIVYAS